MMFKRAVAAGVSLVLAASAAAGGATRADQATAVVRAGTIYTGPGQVIADGVIVIDAAGKIAAVGPASSVTYPAGAVVHECAVAIPGLVDVRSTVGLTGMYNVDHDQDVLEPGAPVQPELRALDAYNPREPLVGYLRSLGVTTAHVGHAPGKLVTGQTAIVKLRGETIEEALVRADAAVTATLGPSAEEGGGKSPGTRGKQISMLRDELFKAQRYLEKVKKAAEKPAVDAEATGDETGEKKDAERVPEPPARDLKAEALAAVLSGEKPLIVTANRAQDIAGALRLGKEFGITVWLDMAAESYLMMDEIKAAGAPVLLHPTMTRHWGETSNASYGTALTLAEGGVRFAIQSGYEGYVPKVRVVLFEAGVAAGYGGLGFERALRAVTIDAATILGIDARVGSIEPGKDADIAMYDGDPFETVTKCLGTLIDGVRYAGEDEYVIGYPGGSEPGQR
jgi:imidazolonepropionase-like amidohydrolase